MVDTITSPHGIFSFFVFFCFGLRKRYFVFVTTFCNSAALIVWESFSLIFSAFSFLIEIVNSLISSIEIESRSLSKNLIVNIKSPKIITPKKINAITFPRLKITPESTRPATDPIPKVILLRERIIPYSVGLELDRIYPKVLTSLSSFVRP